MSNDSLDEQFLPGRNFYVQKIELQEKDLAMKQEQNCQWARN